MTDFFDYAEAGDPDRSGPDQVAAGTFLVGCSPREWQALRQHSSVEIVGPGQTLVRQGEVDRSLFIVLAGSLAARLDGRADKTLDPMLPGEVFGEVAFFDGLPRSSSVVALEESRVLRIAYDSFESLSASEPALARTLLMDLGRALAGRLRAAEARELSR
jgi:CRP-like cAMP-binding protein